jgi:hypothetical protein
MSSFLQPFRAIASTDKFLLLAVAAALLSGIHGITWGRYACLNPDAMASRSVASVPPLHPGNFDKPPLLTYINNILVNESTRAAGWVAVCFGADPHNADSIRQQWRTVISRLLQACFYAGIVIFCYLFARDWFGLAAARVTALLIGTCSGLVPFKIFLTADISLVFWMTACLYFSGRIMRRPDSVRLSVLAGACAGLATATKYNGLGIAVALPLAHFLAPGGFPAAWRRRSFYLCGLAVALAFVLANPYSVLDARKFAGDFMYNYIVTPVYGGQTGTGYGAFLRAFPEIFGLPLAWLLPAVILLGLFSLRGPAPGGARRAMILLAAVFLLYFWKIGGFPRMETRFVLPVAPFVLLLAAPGWQSLARWPLVLSSIVAPLCLYGLASGWYVGHIFTQDARMAGIDWARANMPVEISIEAAGHCPKWKFLEDRKVKDRNFPKGVSRNRLFQEKFADNPWVTVRLAENLKRNDPGLLTPEALRERNPDYITIDSFYLHDTDTAPFVRRLINGELGYRVVFERETPAPPAWVYPQYPDFTRGTFWILARE